LCGCVNRFDSQFTYNKYGQLESLISLESNTQSLNLYPIIECNTNCDCDEDTCSNRIVQKGILLVKIMILKLKIKIFIFIYKRLPILLRVIQLFTNRKRQRNTNKRVHSGRFICDRIYGRSDWLCKSCRTTY
jgi:hypothetical protein